MVIGWILENGPGLKRLSVTVDDDGGLTLSHINGLGDNGMEGGASIDASELDTLIELLTDARERTAVQS